MNILLKIVKGTLAFLLIFTIAVGLCWWLLPDEELDPAAVEFAELTLPPPAEKNAYFLLWGFTASPELDPHAVGRRIVADHDRLLAAQKSLVKSRFDPISSAYLGRNPLTFPDGYRLICSAQSEHCLLMYPSRAAEIESRSETYAVWLARYRNLREYEEFGSPMARLGLATPLISWEPILRMAELVDGAIVLNMQAPATRQAALEELAAEIRLWKRFLQANDNLLTQMVSVAALHRKYQLVSDLLNRHPDVASEYPALLQEITEPLSPRQTNLTASLRAEFAFGLTELMDQDIVRDYIWGFSDQDFARDTLIRALLFAGAYRTNAAINLNYQNVNRIVEFYGNSSPKTLLAESDAFMHQMEKAAALRPDRLFYNPLGRGLFSTSWMIQQYPKQYALRLYHLIAQSRLLEIRRRLIAEQIPAGQVTAMLAAWSPELEDPFTEQPMRWDPEDRRLYFPLPEYMEFNKRWEIATSITLEHLRQ